MGVSVWWSLKTRVIATSTAILLVCIAIASFVANQVLRSDLVELVGQQQRSTVAVLAATTSHEVRIRVDALEQSSTRLATRDGLDAASVQDLSENDRIATLLFNRGLFLTGADGVVIAATPAAADRIGKDYRSQDAVAAAMLRGPSPAARPAVAALQGAPEIAMAVPVHTAQGRLAGVLVGVTDLAAPNFLDVIVSRPYGETGGFFVVAPRQRLIITGTDKTRVLEPLPAAGRNAVIDRIVSGFEGTLVMTNSRGVEVLNSGHPVPLAGWDIVASLPTQEAFAPVRRMQQKLWGATAALLLLGAALGTWLLRRELAPMQRAAQALAHQSSGLQALQTLPVERQDEIGTLIAGFNRLLVALRQREQDLRLNDSALKAISEAVVITDPQGLVLSTNQAHQAITGYANDDMVGRNCRLLQGPLTDPDTVAEIRKAVTTGGSFQGEVLNYRKDSSSFWNDLSIAPVHDEQGQVTHFVGVTRDITLRRSTQDQMARLAFFDVLTQLPNRRLLEDRLTQATAVSERSGLHGAVMFVDLDNFKALNDRHGHDIGDLMLVEVAQLLRASVRATDTVARIGGDEFVVVLGDLAPDAGRAHALAMEVAEKIRHSLESAGWPLPKSGVPEQTRCTVSVGVALFLGQEPRAGDMLRRADAAMYRAKASGGNAVIFHQTES